jgi:hypothetical protein
MKRDLVDFFLIEDRHLAIHIRLENWARYVDSRGIHWNQAPIWKLGKSNGRQWHQPELRTPVDTLDGHALEVAVRALPEPHRDALRWQYVHRSSPSKARRLLGVTNEGLMRLVRDARSMLTNRRV